MTISIAFASGKGGVTKSTLARAVAEERGGELVLSNRAQGGLVAEIRLPR